MSAGFVLSDCRQIWDIGSVLWFVQVLSVRFPECCRMGSYFVKSFVVFATALQLSGSMGLTQFS